MREVTAGHYVACHFPLQAVAERPRPARSRPVTTTPAGTDPAHRPATPERTEGRHHGDPERGGPARPDPARPERPARPRSSTPPSGSSPGATPPTSPSRRWRRRRRCRGASSTTTSATRPGSSRRSTCARSSASTRRCSKASTAATHDGDGEAALRSVVGAYLRFAAENQVAWRLIGAAEATAHPVVQAARQERFRRMAEAWGGSPQALVARRRGRRLPRGSHPRPGSTPPASPSRGPPTS